MLPGLEGGLWQIRNKSDRAALALGDRHYSRRRPGSGQLGPPGRKIVLVTPCERAVWLSHWPDPVMAMDGLDAWRCSIFRNEGAGLSSDLIRAAMLLTAEVWRDQVNTWHSYAITNGHPHPSDGWVTWVDRTKVSSLNPGYCFLKAGWRRDRDWQHPKLIRLRAWV